MLLRLQRSRLTSLDSVSLPVSECERGFVSLAKALAIVCIVPRPPPAYQLLIEIGGSIVVHPHKTPSESSGAKFILAID